MAALEPEAALSLHQEPSTLIDHQVGITSVGILSGAVGEVTRWPTP